MSSEVSYQTLIDKTNKDLNDIIIEYDELFKDSENENIKNTRAFLGICQTEMAKNKATLSEIKAVDILIQLTKVLFILKRAKKK